MLNNNITIGVVVITYNGRNYIKEQLDSILHQTLVPDKVLIFDDKSNDDTVDIIKKYISNNNLKWKLYTNPKNVGWCKNAYNSLKIINTDLIFWSDQDDIWDNKKIETISKVMYENKCYLVYSAWKYIDANGNIKDIKNNKFTNKLIVVNSHKFKTLPPILGCSLCVSKKIILKFSNALFFSCPYNSTDTILYILSMGFGKVMYVDKPLFQRRIHQNNVTLSENSFNKKDVLNDKQMLEIYNMLSMQFKTYNNILKYMLSCNVSKHKVNFLIYESRFIKSRLKYKDDILWLAEHLFYGLKVCSVKNYISILYRDTYFKIKRKK